MFDTPSALTDPYSLKVAIPVRPIIRAGLHAAVLKPASGAAWAQVVAAEFFGELDVAMDEAPSTLDMGFRGKDFRRLREMLKAGEVFEIAMLAHDSLLWV